MHPNAANSESGLTNILLDPIFLDLAMIVGKAVRLEPSAHGLDIALYEDRIP
jgi:hypothetical protein